MGLPARKSIPKRKGPNFSNRRRGKTKRGITIVAVNSNSEASKAVRLAIRAAIMKTEEKRLAYYNRIMREKQTMETPEIQLEKYLEPNTKLIAGKELGVLVREQSGFDKLALNNSENIIVQIPDNVISITPSFLDSFLFNVVSVLGKVDFNRRIQFKENNNLYRFQDDLNRSIDRILLMHKNSHA